MFNFSTRYPEAYSTEYDEMMDILRQFNEMWYNEFPTDEELEVEYQWALAEGLTV